MKKRHSFSFSKLKGTIVTLSLVCVTVCSVLFYKISRQVLLQRTCLLDVTNLQQVQRFIIFLVYVFFMQLAHRGSYTFISLLIKDLGGGNDLVGVSSALMFVSEAVIMFLSKKMLGKMKPEILVMLSSLFFALWHLILSISTQPIHAVLACLMDGPSFALFTVGCLYCMDEIAPPEIRTTYQTVAYSVYFGLSGIVGNMGAGWLIENLGYRPMYRIGMTVTLVSTVVFFFVRRKGITGKTE